jgi:hypothetical protein
MSSSDNRRYMRKKKKEEKRNIQNIQRGEMDLVIPTPDDVQKYIDNKLIELKLKDNGMQLR